MDEEEYQRLRARQLRNKKKAFERHLRRQKAKRQKTLHAAIGKVKSQARRSAWCSTHGNCFRWYDGETEEHVRAKFERFVHWRNMGATVFSELILKNDKRPDLIVCLNNGDVFIEEVAVTESEHSLSEKDDNYPFPVTVIRA